ncbi:DEAD/DEAH box helicase [Nocardia sp. NRRL WC-3656]|uniref:DEAD/DEAH box helicase n=1 Tax=Nocardia sp. NRRL WC-3656 TaxID=1463824 RepID=UPI0004C39B07
MKAADYGLPPNYTLRTEVGSTICPFQVARALQELITTDKLTIDEYLPAMASKPFFLVAATGLGKTVVAPPHVWLQQCADLREVRPGTVPRVWVVEPRVMIADEQGAYMHETFRKLFASQQLGPRTPFLFGSVSSSKTLRPDAPIIFVTTGIFTLRARAGEFDPLRDRVIIDEAHETIGQNPDVELAITICRQAGVKVDYMSATVDTTSIPDLLGIAPDNIIVANKQRHPIYISTTGRTMRESIVEVVTDLLIRRNQDSPLLPAPNHALRERIIADLFGDERRAHGLLVAINSLSGSNSDAVVIQKQLKEARLQSNGTPLAVLELSSKQTKNPAEMARFTEALAKVEQRAEPYVVVATSVIEMGVTIGTLDFAVTMDSGYENVVVGDRSLPTVTPLPFNSLKQRLGRVGRRRAGIGIITTDVGAPYTEFGREKLNSPDLEYEPVRTPLAKASLLSLAYYTFERGWRTPAEIGEGLARLRLPSRRALLTIPRLTQLVEERRYLMRLGVADTDANLTSAGRSVGPWIGDGYLPYAVRLQAELAKPTPDRLGTLFWIVALACSDSTLSVLMRSRVSLDQMTGAPSPFDLTADQLCRSNELIALYQVVAFCGRAFGPYLDEQRAPLLSLHRASLSGLDRLCEALGMDTNKVKELLTRVSAVIARVPKVNRDRPGAIKHVFGTRTPRALGDVAWPTITDRDVDRLTTGLHQLPGRPALQLDVEERKDGTPMLFWASGGRRICRAGSAVTAPNGSTPRFSGRVLLLHRPTPEGFWLDVAHVTELR